MLPTTVSFSFGVDVPMPTLPIEIMLPLALRLLHSTVAKPRDWFSTFNPPSGIPARFVRGPEIKIREESPPAPALNRISSTPTKRMPLFDDVTTDPPTVIVPDEAIVIRVDPPTTNSRFLF